MIRFIVFVYAVFVCGCSALYDQARVADASLQSVELGYAEALREIEGTAEPHYSALRAKIDECYAPVFQAHELFVTAWQVAEDTDHPADLERASAYFAVFEMLAHSVCAGAP